MVEIKLKKLSNFEGLEVPAYATSDSAGMDLRAAIESDVVIKPLQRILIKTGFAIALPSGYEAQVRPRSGLALKHGVTVLNTPGTIDADYRGEVGVILVNLSSEDFTITRGFRIAQMVISKYETAEIKVVEDLDDTQRGGGGFGSTGVDKINNPNNSKKG